MDEPKASIGRKDDFSKRGAWAKRAFGAIDSIFPYCHDRMCGFQFEERKCIGERRRSLSLFISMRDATAWPWSEIWLQVRDVLLEPVAPSD
jgi:hypothetical protein